MISSRIKKIFTITSVIFGLLIVSGVYYFTYSPQGHIYEFYPMRDTQPILDIFKKNWKELVEDDAYSPEYMMKNRLPDKDRPCFGKLKIGVMREKNKLAGFTAYYRETPKKGIILFLAVDHNFRGKRYGHLLMQYAIDDLLSMGARHIGLWVLIDNVPARRIYEKLGFVEKFTDDSGKNVYLEYSKKV